MSMRKVHEKAIKMLLETRPGVAGPRDTVMWVQRHPRPEHMFWLYHGNIIARFDSEGVAVNWQGWFTYSTSMRIKALCDYLGVARPKQQEGWIQLCS